MLNALKGTRIIIFSLFLTVSDSCVGSIFLYHIRLFCSQNMLNCCFVLLALQIMNIDSKRIVSCLWSIENLFKVLVQIKDWHLQSVQNLMTWNHFILIFSLIATKSSIYSFIITMNIIWNVNEIILTLFKCLRNHFQV